ncbi:MAG: TolC family protein [Sedimentisphaerales bacterium]|nr:TolC family protein [Sedimentisphaerales bacterium]
MKMKKGAQVTNAQVHKLRAHRQLTLLRCCALLLLSGCVSKERYFDDVTLSRESAYEQWENRKQAEKQIQSVITGQLSLDDCIKLTLTNNKALLKTLEEKEVARGAEIGSYSAILPSVDLIVNYERLDKIQSFGPISLGSLDNYSANLRVTQPLFAGGAIPARINAARLGLLLADQTVCRVVQDTVYFAQLDYYAVLLYQHLNTISDDAVKSSKAHLEDVRTKKEAGVAADFDVLRAEVELSNFTADLIRTRNAINVAKSTLIKVMGVSQDSNFILSDELTYSVFNITMEEAVSNAYRNRPDLFTREINIRQQKELLAIAQSQYFPVISAFYQNTWSKPDPHNRTFIDWGEAWSTGLTAAWPLFDGFAREGSIIEQKARVKQSQIDLVDTEETALFELTREILSIQDANEFVESQRMNLTRAEEGLRLAEVGYHEGINTQVEMLDAQSALTEAKANYYQAIYNHLRSKLDLHRAMGTLTRFETKTGNYSSKNE